MCARFLEGTLSVEYRREMDAMPRSDRFDFLHPLSGNESSSQGERLELAFQRQGHALKKTSVSHIGEWMPIQNSAEIRRETQSARDLPQAAKEDRGSRHPHVRMQVFRIPGVANNRFRRNATQQKRW